MQTTDRPTILGGAAPRVSIVLPLYNSSKDLGASLTQLDQQTYMDREIILVDDGSSDATWETATALSSGRDDMTLVRTEHLGPAHARNVGLSRSRGDIVIFAESDCVYDHEYVARAVECLDTNKEASAVCLTGAPLITRSTMATSCIDIENKVQHRLLNQGRIEPFYAWVFRRGVLQDLGGFDDSLFQGEDRDLFKRLKDAKYTVAWVPGISWRHVRNQTTLELARKWFGRGRTRLLYLIKHRRILEMAKSLVPFWATVFGLILVPFFPFWGLLILILVTAAFLARTLRTMSISWGQVPKKRDYAGYPLFILVRNFCTGIGYTAAFFTMIRLRLQRKEVTWGSF